MANVETAVRSTSNLRVYEAAGQIELANPKISDFLDDLQTGAAGALGTYDTNGAVGIKHGLAIITKAGVAALTLAAPTTGTDDGKVLRFVSTTANAHTVTTPSGKINGGSLTVGTFGAAIGNGMTLVAYGGVWYTLDVKGVTVS